MRPAISERYRRALAAAVLALGLIVLLSPAAAAALAQEPAATQERTAENESVTGEAEAHGWGATIAKAVNFAILAGILVYFLKSPVATHLRTRAETIRKDLTEAAGLRQQAEQQLAEVRARLAKLPAELDLLRRRGEEELAAERIRLAEATQREREHIVERMEREIDLQFRIARRRLLEHTADLAMSLARTRIERDITPADQARLIDRYAAEVRS